MFLKCDVVYQAMCNILQLVSFHLQICLGHQKTNAS